MCEHCSELVNDIEKWMPPNLELISLTFIYDHDIEVKMKFW